MSEKKSRILGMFFFIILFTFTLWYFDFERTRLVGFRTHPYGYGSYAYQILVELFGESYYPHKSTNNLWIATQIVPIILAWIFRISLGRFAAHIVRTINRIYKAV